MRGQVERPHDGRRPVDEIIDARPVVASQHENRWLALGQNLLRKRFLKSGKCDVGNVHAFVFNGVINANSQDNLESPLKKKPRQKRPVRRMSKMSKGRHRLRVTSKHENVNL